MRKLTPLLAFLLVSTASAQQLVGNVAIGPQPSLQMLDSLAAEGFEAVLSTRGADELDWDEGAAVDSLGMTFVRIAMEKPVSEITDEQVAEFADFMVEAPKAYLHCGSGNRVATLWAVWLVEREGANPDSALAMAELAGMTPAMRDVATRRLDTTAPDP